MSVTFDGDLTIARPAGPRRWYVPFIDSKKWYFEQDFQQLLQNYDPILLDELYLPTTSGSSADLKLPCYLVHESDPQDLGGGIVQWTRTYSAIPDSRIEHESYAHTFPGLETGSLGPLRYITGTPTNAASVTTITTTVSHGISVGDQVIIRYTNVMPDGTQLGRQIFRTALTGTTGATLKVSIVIDGSALYWLTAQKADIGRDAFSEETTSWLNYDYFLPGITAGISTFQDIPIINSPIIVDGDGARTDTYTATTAPTKTEYLTDVKNKTPHIAHDSVLRRWKGNIYERVTRYIIPK